MSLVAFKYTIDHISLSRVKIRVRDNKYRQVFLIFFTFFRVQVIISGMYDYSDPIVQKQIENLTQTFENTSYISNTLYTESWLRSFLVYAERNKDYLNISIDTKEDFIDNLKKVR